MGRRKHGFAGSPRRRRNSGARMGNKKDRERGFIFWLPSSAFFCVRRRNSAKICVSTEIILERALMEKMIIEGGHRLVGANPRQRGQERCLATFRGLSSGGWMDYPEEVPALADIRTISRLLRQMGVKVEGDRGDGSAERCGSSLLRGPLQPG